MAKIDQDGIKQIKQHVMNPMTSLYEKLDGDAFESVRDEFQHVVDFVKNIETDWKVDGLDENMQVVINGKIYKQID